MKLTKGTKPDKIEIPDNISYTLENTNGYIEIEIDDIKEINKLKTRGFKVK